MKKLKGILSIFIVMIMALSVQIPVFAAEQMIAPKVTFSNFSVDKTTIKPGDIFTFTVTASSTRGQYIDDASFKFSDGDAFSVYKGSDTEYVSSFGSSVTVSKTFICNNETTAGSHPISVSCNFSYSGHEVNGDGSAEANYSVMTSSGSTTTGNTPVLVMSYEKFAEDIKAGDKFNFDFYITNKSTAYDVRNVNVKINGGDAFTVVNSGDTIYKNGIAKNQTAEFSKKLICNKSVSSGYHPISLSVTYEYVKAGATEQGTAEATFTVKTAAKKHDSSVSLTPRLVVGSFNYGNKSIRGGKKFTLNFTIKNNSKRIKAKN